MQDKAQLGRHGHWHLAMLLGVVQLLDVAVNNKLC